MKFIIKATIVLLFAVVAVAVGGNTKASAQALPQSQTPAQTATQTVYSYTAQAGDSYSQMARKAVQTYGKKFTVVLNNAQIMYAETNLTQEAGSPLLEVGQKVDINEVTLKSWVEKAKALSQDDQAAWGYYAAMADFNTDAVGQAS